MSCSDRIWRMRMICDCQSSCFASASRTSARCVWGGGGLWGGGALCVGGGVGGAVSTICTLHMHTCSHSHTCQHIWLHAHTCQHICAHTSLYTHLPTLTYPHSPANTKQYIHIYVHLPPPPQFCPDVAPGNARAKECLEEHRNDDGFSEDCRKELEHMIELRVGDFRLDPIMRKHCAEDVEAV